MVLNLKYSSEQTRIRPHFNTVDMWNNWKWGPLSSLTCIRAAKKGIPEATENFLMEQLMWNAYRHTIHTNYAGMPINMLASLELHLRYCYFFIGYRGTSFNIPCIRIFQSLIIIKSINCKNWVTPMYNVIRQKFVKGNIALSIWKVRRRRWRGPIENTKILKICGDLAYFVSTFHVRLRVSTSLRRRSADHPCGLQLRIALKKF